MWLGNRALTNKPTCDPALNLVMASVTYDVDQFLGDNVGDVMAHTDMSPTFTTKSFATNFKVKGESSENFQVFKVSASSYCFSMSLIETICLKE